VRLALFGGLFGTQLLDDSLDLILPGQLGILGRIIGGSSGIAAPSASNSARARFNQ
jgi:hypothetical protein